MTVRSSANMVDRGCCRNLLSGRACCRRSRPAPPSSHVLAVAWPGRRRTHLPIDVDEVHPNSLLRNQTLLSQRPDHFSIDQAHLTPGSSESVDHPVLINFVATDDRPRPLWDQGLEPGILHGEVSTDPGQDASLISKLTHNLITLSCRTLS